MLLYVLAPEKLIGWVRKPSPAELEFLNPKVRDLPEIGRLTGRGDTANLEVVLKAKPDVIIDFGTVNPTYVSLADRVQAQTGIPYLLIDGRLASTAASMKLVGNILGVDVRANALADQAAAILGEAEQTVTAVPEAQRPRVYLARQANGLQTGNRGSINTEIIERAGGINVATGGREGGGLFNVSPEQVIAWNPDTVITVDANFFGFSAFHAGMVGHRGGEERSRVPQSGSALRLDRRTTIAQPPAWAAVAAAVVLPATFQWRHAGADARFLPAVLSG